MVETSFHQRLGLVKGKFVYLFTLVFGICIVLAGPCVIFVVNESSINKQYSFE